MNDDILRDLQARFKPGMSQEEVAAVLLDDTLVNAGPAGAAALLAAAVPHWFDAPLLAALLEASEPEAAGRLARLAEYSFVSQRADGAYLYHETTRSGLLARVKADPDRFRELSRRAANFFERQWAGSAEKGVPFMEFAEWLYHSLAVDDAPAFDRLTAAYHDLEFRYDLAACGWLLALTQEQADRLTADRPLWLRYYQGRLLQYSQRWGAALATWEPLLHEALTPRLKSWLANHLGGVYASQGRWAEALAQYAASLELMRALGDRQGEAATLNNIGAVYRSQGRWAEALAQYAASLELMRALGDRQGEANTLMGIGNVYQSQGRWAEALTQYAASLELKRALGDRQGEAYTLESLGDLHSRRGEWEQAHLLLQQTLEIARQLGDKELEAYMLHDLGEWHKRQGQWDGAISRYGEALALRRELGAQAQVGETLDALGEVYRLRGMWAEAVQTHEEALVIWRALARPG